MKRALALIVMGLVLVCGVTGCGEREGPQSVPAGESAAVSVARSAEMDEFDHEATAEEKLQQLLDGFADGTYPHEIIFGTDIGFVVPVPEGTALPASAREAQYSYTYARDEGGMWDHWLSVLVELENEYQMEMFLVLPDKYSNTTAIQYTRFFDLRPAVSGGAYSGQGLELSEVEGDRLSLTGNVGYLEVDGEVWTGAAQWDAVWRFMGVHLFTEGEDGQERSTHTIWMLGEGEDGVRRFSHYDDSPEPKPFEGDEEKMAEALYGLYEGLLAAYEEMATR